MTWTDITIGNLTVRGGVATVAGKELPLTAFETRTLNAIATGGGGYVSTQKIEQLVYADRGDSLPGANSLQVFVSRLRRKLRDAGANVLLGGRRGDGYRLTAVETAQ